MSIILNRPLPSAEASEKVILGAILLNNELLAEVSSSLTPEHFTSPVYRSLYETMLRLYESGRPIDPVTICSEYSDPASVGGISAITELSYGLPYFSDLNEYIRIVSTYYTARRLVVGCSNIVSQTLDSPADVEAHLEQAESTLFGISTGRENSGFVDLNQLVCASLSRIRNIDNGSNGTLGVSTGYCELDSRTSGLHSSNLIILAARPSMGKTALGLNIAQNICFRNNGSVAFFSLEMSEEEIADRIICSEAGINTLRYTSGSLQEDEWELLHQIQERIQDARLYVDDTPAVSVAHIRQQLRRLIHRFGNIDCVVVDYLQLMSGDSKEGREREVAKISRDLKSLAKEFNLPVLALSQLNRSPETRSSHLPTLSDLRESGAIEQDADVVIFIY